MTRVFVCAAFHMHFGCGYRLAGRANLIACVGVDCKINGRRSRGRENIEYSCDRAIEWLGQKIKPRDSDPLSRY